MMKTILAAIFFFAVVTAATLVISQPASADEFIVAETLESCKIAVKKGGPFKYPDACWEKSMTTHMVTVDVRVTPDRALLKYLDIEIPGIKNVRSEGYLVQIYYSGVMGKAQWNIMPSLSGVVIMPHTVSLPIEEWVKRGFTVGGFVRLVIMMPT